MGVMGIDKSDVKNLAESITADGREFGHKTELLRDARVNGASRVDFGIEPQAFGAPGGALPAKGRSVPRSLDDEGILREVSRDGKRVEVGQKPGVARRMIASDDRGMTEEVLRGPYSKFGASGSPNDPWLLRKLKKVAESGVFGLHKRKGMGGRFTTMGWNPYGVTTISICDGRVLMMQTFRSLEGDFRTRVFPKFDGDFSEVVPPFVEENSVNHLHVMADSVHAAMVAVRSGLASESDVRSIVSPADAEPGDFLGFVNPEAGIDWAKAIPEWVADDVVRHADGSVTANLDGKPAHGVVKVLMGDNPTHSTALTGDPNYPRESKADQYRGFLQRNIADLEDLRVRVTVLYGRDGDGKSADAFTGYRIKNRDKTLTVTLDTTEIQGLRPTLEDSAEFASDDIPIEVRGREASFSVSLQPEKESKTNWASTTTRGTIAVNYIGELHHSTSSSRYRRLGVDSSIQKRVSVLIELPLAEEGLEGVHQTTARDSLKYSGQDSLPWPEIEEAIRQKMPQQILDAGYASTVKKRSSDKRWTKRLKGLLQSGKRTKVVKVTKEVQRPTGVTPVPALLADASAAAVFPGTPSGSQGKRRDCTPRPPCPECGLKIHAADCSLKPDRSQSGGRGGRGGEVTRLAPDPQGDTLGRKSRAKTDTATFVEREEEFDETQELTDFEPPEFVWVSATDWTTTESDGQDDDSMLLSRALTPAEWCSTGDLAETGGRIKANAGYAVIAERAREVAKRTGCLYAPPSDLELAEIAGTKTALGMTLEHYERKFVSSVVSLISAANSGSMTLNPNGKPTMDRFSQDIVVGALSGNQVFWSILHSDPLTDEDTIAEQCRRFVPKTKKRAA